MTRCQVKTQKLSTGTTPLFFFFFFLNLTTCQDKTLLVVYKKQSQLVICVVCNLHLTILQSPTHPQATTMVSPHTKFFIILLLQLVILILDYPNTPNFTLPKSSSFAPPQQTQFSNLSCMPSCIHLLNDSKEAFQKLIVQSAADLDLRKRICADMSDDFNISHVFLRIALEVLLDCDNSNHDIVQNQEVVQQPT